MNLDHLPCVSVSLTLFNAILYHRIRNSLVLAADQMTQKVLSSQAPLPQTAREPTNVLAKIPLPLDRLACIVPFTTGRVQPEKKDVFSTRCKRKLKIYSSLSKTFFYGPFAFCS